MRHGQQAFWYARGRFAERGVPDETAAKDAAIFAGVYASNRRNRTPDADLTLHQQFDRWLVYMRGES